MPNTLGFVEGIINNRGKLFPSLMSTKDLSPKKIKLPLKKEIIIAKLSDDFHGILVNNIEGIIKVKQNDLKKVPDILEDVDKKFFSKIIKLEDGNENIFLIDLKEFLDFEIALDRKAS